MGSRSGAIGAAVLVAVVVFAALWASGPPPEPIRPGQAWEEYDPYGYDPYGNQYE